MFAPRVPFQLEVVNGMEMLIVVLNQSVCYVELDVISALSQNGTELWLHFQRKMDLQEAKPAPEDVSVYHSCLTVGIG